MGQYPILSSMLTTSQVLEFKMFSHHFVKLIRLCQLLQLWPDFDELFKKYFSPCRLEIQDEKNSLKLFFSFCETNKKKLLNKIKIK